MNVTVPVSEPRPVAADSNDEIPGVCFRVFGQVILGDGTELACGVCGRTYGPWLLSAFRDVAYATCEAGHRGTHPELTPELIERLFGSIFEAAYPSLDQAERDLGFG